MLQVDVDHATEFRLKQIIRDERRKQLEDYQSKQEVKDDVKGQTSSPRSPLRDKQLVTIDEILKNIDQLWEGEECDDVVPKNDDKVISAVQFFPQSVSELEELLKKIRRKNQDKAKRLNFAFREPSDDKKLEESVKGHLKYEKKLNAFLKLRLLNEELRNRVNCMKSSTNNSRNPNTNNTFIKSDSVVPHNAQHIFPHGQYPQEYQHQGRVVPETAEIYNQPPPSSISMHGVSHGMATNDRFIQQIIPGKPSPQVDDDFLRSIFPEDYPDDI